jgi:hypothetical protein
VDSLSPYYGCFFPFVHSVTVRFLLRSQSSFPYLLFSLIHCSLFISMFMLWFSVSLHSYSKWSTDSSVLQKGHIGLPTSSILEPWVALVYLVRIPRIPQYSYIPIPFVSYFLSTSGFRFIHSVSYIPHCALDEISCIFNFIKILLN